MRLTSAVRRGARPRVWRTPQAGPLEPHASRGPGGTQALPARPARPPPARPRPEQRGGSSRPSVFSSTKYRTDEVRIPIAPTAGDPLCPPVTHTLVPSSHRCRHLPEVWGTSQASPPGAAPPGTAAVPEAAPALERPSPASVRPVAGTTGCCVSGACAGGQSGAWGRDWPCGLSVLRESATFPGHPGRKQGPPHTHTHFRGLRQ